MSLGGVKLSSGKDSLFSSNMTHPTTVKTVASEMSGRFSRTSRGHNAEFPFLYFMCPLKKEKRPDLL